MRTIVETYAAPNKTLHDVADSVNGGGLDPLRDFSDACREEFMLPDQRARLVVRATAVSSNRGDADRHVVGSIVRREASGSVRFVT